MPSIVICVEAEYAYNKRKPIVPLRVEADYQPDGWLGPLCINNLYYDFSAPTKASSEWAKLRTKLQQLKVLRRLCSLFNYPY